MARFSYNETYSVPRSTKTCTFTNAGYSTWTVPAGVNCATFETWGGGGGGGAKCCCDCYHMSGGGGPGAYAVMTVPVVSGDTYIVCVGYGGMQTGVGDAAHWCCYGQDGTTTYVIGTNISTLCAAGGTGSHNMCYTSCMCTNCGGSTYARGCASSALLADKVSCAVGNCYVCGNASGTRQHSFTNVWTDSQSMFYSGVVGGTAFSSSELFTNEACCLCRPACKTSRMAGNGGEGAINAQNCCCYQAWSGRNGQVIIRY